MKIVPEGLNKSAYFLLPLLGLSKYSYGNGSNFYNSYMSFNGKIVSIVIDKSEAGEYHKHPNYLTDFDLIPDAEKPDNIATAIVYSIPEVFTEDLGHFSCGQYSKMSKTAKNLIRKHSGLPYRNPIPGSTKVSTHKLLMVLDKSEVLRKWIEAQCDIEISPEQELLEKPHYDWEYMDIDTVSI